MAKALFIQPHKLVRSLNLERITSDNLFLAERTDGFARAVPSLPAMTVLGTLENRHEAKFIDATADNSHNIFSINNYLSAVGLSDEELCEKVSETKPDVILLTSMFTVEYPMVNYISKLIKEKFNLPIVVGGHHAELRPAWHFDDGEVDVISLGEGELNINQILDLIDDKIPISDVKGISFKDSSGEIKTNPKENLMNLNYPWDIKSVVINENGLYRYPTDLVTRNPGVYLPKNIFPKGSGVLYGSRGCPWGCEYCNSTERDGSKIKHMSLERMIELTKEFISLGSNVFHNESDTFGIHPIDREFLQWVSDQRISGQDINLINTNSFFAKYFFSGDVFSPERVDLLKDAGFGTITVSVESFNPKFNRGKLKGITPEMLNECLFYIKGKGLKTDLYMIYLFPEQTEEELREDINSVEKLSPNLTTTTWRSLTYFPGTTYYDWAIRSGKFSEEDYKKLTYNGHSFYHVNDELNFSYIKNPPDLKY